MGGAGENSLRQRMRNGRICVFHSGKAYDVTEFSERHPGGKEWLMKYAGQDVTQVMRDQTPHTHSNAAYAILEKYRIREVHENGKQQVSVCVLCDFLPLQQTTDNLVGITPRGFVRYTRLDIDRLASQSTSSVVGKSPIHRAHHC